MAVRRLLLSFALVFTLIKSSFVVLIQLDVFHGIFYYVLLRLVSCHLFLCCYLPVLSVCSEALFRVVDEVYDSSTSIISFLYPTLLRVDEYLIKASDDFEETSAPLALTTQSLDPRGLYIYDDGFSFIIWFGSMLPPDLTNNLLGNFSGFHDLSKADLCELDNDVSRRLVKILNKLRQNDPSFYQLCHMLRQGEQPRESSLLLPKLVEDQSAGANSYLDWILQIHRQSQTS